MMTLHLGKLTSFENMGNFFSTCGFWCLFLDSHPTINHSNTMDACLHLLFFLIRHLYLIDVWFNEDERTNQKTHLYKRLDTKFKFHHLHHTQ